jgi:hypothetical protein
MTSTRLASALCLVATLTAACGPMADASLSPADQQAADPALLGRATSGGVASAVTALSLPSSPIPAGATITGSVTAGGGALVYLTYPKSLFAGPGWVRVPAGASSATFTLHVSPFVAADATATFSARTSTPNVGGFVSQPVTVAAAPALPAARPQVSSATFSSTTLVTGASATGTVTLTTPAPAVGAAVQLAISNDFLGLDADVPAVVVVPAGATSATFPIHAHLSSPALTSVMELPVANLFGGTFQGAVITVTR